MDKIETILEKEKKKIYELVFYKERSIYSKYDPDFVGIIRKYIENIIVNNLTKIVHKVDQPDKYQMTVL